MSVARVLKFADDTEDVLPASTASDPVLHKNNPCKNVRLVYYESAKYDLKYKKLSFSLHLLVVTA